jgi:hypothetical protein
VSREPSARPSLRRRLAAWASPELVAGVLVVVVAVMVVVAWRTGALQ